MGDSLHVPASTMQRLGAVARWLAPYAVAGALAAAGYSWRWFESRPSRETVGELTGNAMAAAHAAEATAHTAAVLANQHKLELSALWLHIIAVRAELQVLQQYSRQDAPTRHRYIQAAQGFYAREYETQLARRPLDPAEAARLALLATWRPDR